MLATDRYEVIVGNVGIVYCGNDRNEADRIFDEYVRQSKDVVGCRAEGEDVAILEHWKTGVDCVREHTGHLQAE